MRVISQKLSRLYFLEREIAHAHNLLSATSDSRKCALYRDLIACYQLEHSMLNCALIADCS